MNYKTNFYGAIGLVSTLGKNSFAAGEAVSGWVKGSCHFIRENIVEVDLAITGKVFEKLENVSKWSEEKCKSAKTTCQEWETWTNEKYETAKAQEELNEDWKQNVNEKWTLPQPSKLTKVQNWVKEKQAKIWPEKRYILPHRENIHSPSYLQRVLGAYVR